MIYLRNRSYVVPVGDDEIEIYADEFGRIRINLSAFNKYMEPVEFRDFLLRIVDITFEVEDRIREEDWRIEI